MALLYDNQGRYADAEPLYQRSLAIREKALGRDHPAVATALNNLAYLYLEQACDADALPIIRRTMAQGTAEKSVAFPVLFASQGHSLLSAAQVLMDSYEIVQRASSSAAASAVSKLASRFAAGTGELAQLVRKDQDLTAEAEALDKTVIAFVSKPPAQRSAMAEEQVRMRIAEVKTEREKLQQVFNQRFPDYTALSRPQPVSVSETQAPRPSNTRYSYCPDVLKATRRTVRLSSNTLDSCSAAKPTNDGGRLSCVGRIGSKRARFHCPWCIVLSPAYTPPISTAMESTHDPTRRLQLRAASPYD